MPHDNLDIHVQNMKVVHYLTPYTKINSKGIKDLNGRSKTIKFLNKNLGINIQDLGLGNDFLDMMPKV